MNAISYPERWSNSLEWCLILQPHSLSFQLNWANKFLLHWVISATLVAWSLHYQVTGSMHHGQSGVAGLNLSLEAVDVLAVGLVIIVLNAWLHEVNSLKHHDIVFNLLCLLLFTYKVIQWIFISLSWWLKSEPSTGYVWSVHHFQFALAQCTWSLNVANVDQSVSIVQWLLIWSVPVFTSMAFDAAWSLHVFSSFTAGSRPHTADKRAIYLPLWTCLAWAAKPLPRRYVHKGWIRHASSPASWPWPRSCFASRTNRSEGPSGATAFHFACIDICHRYKFANTVSISGFIPYLQNLQNQIVILSLCFSFTELILLKCLWTQVRHLLGLWLSLVNHAFYIEKCIQMFFVIIMVAIEITG